MFETARTYHYTVVARKFVKTRRVGVAPVVTITLLIAAAERAEVVAMNAVANEDIGKEFYE